MPEGKLPAWMTTRSHREISEGRKYSNVPEFAMLSIFSVFVVGSILAALMFEPVFHLPVIGASITALILAIASRAEGTAKTFVIFAASAVAANALMGFTSTFIEHDSALVAIAVVILFTGLIGLLLFSRTRVKPSRSTKAAVMGGVVLVAAAGPMLYLTSPEGEVLEYVTGWFLLVSIPMTFVSVMTGLVMISYHRKEQTLPSDKWV